MISVAKLNYTRCLLVHWHVCVCTYSIPYCSVTCCCCRYSLFLLYEATSASIEHECQSVKSHDSVGVTCIFFLMKILHNAREQREKKGGKSGKKAGEKRKDRRMKTIW